MPITICLSAIQNQIEGMKKAQSFKYSHASDVQKVNIADIQDCSGKQPSYRWFNGRGQKAKEVYAISSFGIFLLAMRQRNPNEEWLKSSTYKSINKIVNTVCLEQFSSEATSGNHASAKSEAHSHGKTNPYFSGKRKSNKRLLFSLNAR